MLIQLYSNNYCILLNFKGVDKVMMLKDKMFDFPTSCELKMGHWENSRWETPPLVKEVVQIPPGSIHPEDFRPCGGDSSAILPFFLHLTNESSRC